jgi:AAA domain
MTWDGQGWSSAARDYHANREPAQRQAVPFRFVLPRDITLQPKAFLIDGFVGAAETSAWYGPPDGGKSTVVLDAGCHVAAGLDYCGRRVTQGCVLYIAVERGAVVQRRVLAWCQHHAHMDIPLAVVAEMIDLRTGQVDADRIIATAKAFAQAGGLPVVWIIIDTLNRALAGGDENSSKDMGAVIAAVDRIQRATNAHCSLIHHVPVDRTDRMRGHSSVLGAVDLTVRITKEGKGKTVTVEADKANDLVERPRFAFQFEPVELARDGLTVATAPVLVPCDTPLVAEAAKRKAMPKGAQIALRALAEAIDEVGNLMPASSHIPARTKTVTFEQWRTYAYGRGISTSDEPRARQQAFKRATEYLIGEEHVGVWNNQAWPTKEQANTP